MFDDEFELCVFVCMFDDEFDCVFDDSVACLMMTCHVTYHVVRPAEHQLTECLQTPQCTPHLIGPDVGPWLLHKHVI